MNWSNRHSSVLSSKSCECGQSRRALLSFALSFFVVFASATSAIANSKNAKSLVSANATHKSLDEQVQEIKSDVLAIAAELNNLEEKLIFPSNTQVAIFVAVDAPEERSKNEDSGEPPSLSLESARVSIDGEVVSQHLYSFNEIKALTRGGVQKLYTGNLRTGGHSVEVNLSGSRPDGESFEEVKRFEFEKQVDPKALAVVVSPRGAGSFQVEIEDW